MQIKPESYTEEAWSSIIYAQEIAKNYCHQYIENEHIFSSLINKSELVGNIIKKSNGSIKIIRERVDEFLKSKPRLKEKPKDRKNIMTLVKPENKISELWPLLKKEISFNRQLFWICPLIEESNNLNYSSAYKKYDLIKKIFPNQVGLIHGSMDKK